MNLRQWIHTSLLVAAVCTTAQANDLTYYHVPFGKLALKDKSLPVGHISARIRSREYRHLIRPHARLAGQGEIYVAHPDRSRFRHEYGSSTVAICVPQGQEVSGFLYLPNSNMTGFVEYPFVVPGTSSSTSALTNFYQLKENHYRYLLNRSIPGAALFRHKMREATQMRTGKDLATPARARRAPRRRTSELSQTYSLFTGGRAMSENLQLDRILPSASDAEATVDIATLTGITVQEFDWTSLIADASPRLDRLAEFIPADQHALFFPSFDAMTRMVDEATVIGVPILRLIEPRSEDAMTRARYEQQLCVQLNAIARKLGPKLVSTIAVTGSDPYLRTGSDVAVLIETPQATLVTGILAANHLAAEGAHPDVKRVHGTANELTYTGVVTPTRSISSYLSVHGNVVIIANSLHQLQRVADVINGTTAPLAGLPEYTYFRNRYTIGKSDETGFLFLSDATIRRWCGPRWRIATSRRTRAAAVLSELQAAHLSDLVGGAAPDIDVPASLAQAGLGAVRVTPRGVASDVYNTLSFLTPIAEIPLDKVSKAEVDIYNRWRDGYQRNWSNFFDPIGLRFLMTPDRSGLDMTIMPLILSSDYTSIREIAMGSRIKSTSGDLHDDALLHLIIALNPKAQMLRGAGNFLAMGGGPTAATDPFDWIGTAVSLYADQDPFWQEVMAAEDVQDFFEEEFYRLPLALNIDVRNPLKLAGFLTALRAMVLQSAPGMTVWETLTYKEQPYVKVQAATGDEEPEGGEPAWQRLAVYYVATPGALVITLSETVLKNALDRRAGRRAAKRAGTPIEESPDPWLGDHLGMQVSREMFDILQTVFEDNYRKLLQVRSWGNLPILNELKRLFPDRDPLDLYKKFWQTHLVCPGGGSYEWNDPWHTYESTVYGHPGKPRKGPTAPPAIEALRRGSFGITFEDEGLRTRVRIQHDGKQ